MFIYLASKSSLLSCFCLYFMYVKSSTIILPLLPFLSLLMLKFLSPMGLIVVSLVSFNFTAVNCSSISDCCFTDATSPLAWIVCLKPPCYYSGKTAGAVAICGFAARSPSRWRRNCAVARLVGGYSGGQPCHWLGAGIAAGAAGRTGPVVVGDGGCQGLAGYGLWVV